MTDQEQQKQADEDLQALYAKTKADLSRKRREMRKLGEYLQDFGKALIERPERIIISQPGMTDTEQDWFLVTQNLPTLKQIQTLALDLASLGSLVQSLGQDLRDRGLPA